MIRLKILILLTWILTGTCTTAQVKVRIFAGEKYSSAVFSVNSGSFRISCFIGKDIEISHGETLLIALYDKKVILKRRGQRGIICDSLILKGETGNDYFSLRINGEKPVRQYYSGDLFCKPDLGTLIFLNSTDLEDYIAGVVRAESGPGKNIQYSKTQAVIARTYLYKYIDKHRKDGFNVCDNTHCQAFDGISNDSIIYRAVKETRGEVILDGDSVLIISAFHSNCGGETSPSEYVWLTGQSYLKKVVDPYCISSPNAQWQKSIPIETWKECLFRNGLKGQIDDPRMLFFSQPSRTDYLKVGPELIPLRQIRSDLGLWSAFFSVTVNGDSVILKGRGYGHGVGLCQEGAFTMARRGFDYKQIISFYYHDIIITDIRNAVIR